MSERLFDCIFQSLIIGFLALAALSILVVVPIFMYLDYSAHCSKQVELSRLLNREVGWAETNNYTLVVSDGTVFTKEKR